MQAQSVPIKEISFLTPAPHGRRYMVMLRFYCDESYDSKAKKPNSYVVGGFVSDEEAWDRIERQWAAKNKRVGVSRFHASHLNARDHEFKGWTPQRSKRYVVDLLRILKRQKRRLQAVSVGILNKEYERIIPPESRIKFGSPYIVCFKEAVALLAEEMHRWWKPEDKFSVVFDQNDFEKEALEVFYKMKANTTWPPHIHLAACVPGSWQEYIALQPADLIAYETFRLMHEKHYGSQKVRKALEKLLPTNGFSGFYYEPETLERLKEPLAEATCEPNGFIVIHNVPYTGE